MQPNAGEIDPLLIACDALANIAMISANSWSSHRERDDALAQINVLALGAWAQIQGR